MEKLRPETLCIQAGYTPGNGEPRQLPTVQPATELRIFGKRRVAADNALRTLAVVVHPLGPSTGTAQKYLPPEGRWPSVREVG